MPEFHGDGLRTYLTSYPLPALPEFDSGNSDQNPREAPSIALQEEIRSEMHEYMEDGLMLPSYDSHHLPIKYSRVVAKPGEPLQVHFMVWFQQVLHDMDLPNGEDEFLDLRVELSCNGQIVDVGYINQSNIKPNGIPVGIEFVGQRCGDARETPLFFTAPQSPTQELKESILNILVTVGRIGGFFYYDVSRAMSKMVRVGPYQGKYESSTLGGQEFTGYIWRKEHQNLIRPNRNINPKTKLYEWRRKWMDNDVYRIGVERRAYERCKKEWEELERDAEGDAEATDVVIANEDPLEIMEKQEMPPTKKLKLTYANIDGPLETIQSMSTKGSQESPYSFRRARRIDTSNISITSANQPVSYPPTNKTQHKFNKQHTSPLSTTNKQNSPSGSSFHRSTKGSVLTSAVQKDDPQQPSLSNVTFGAFPYKTTREYYREFIPYQDLCRIQYLVVNPKTRELRSGTIEVPHTGTRELRSSARTIEKT
ncbi:hypothetical protein TWF730_002189 [Orbilia blumenaviensis]|uniref:Uncharacterized protein n=1 Tax=Orbilia blumenaviensis TaxID=1796055 RepID=A0AAV9UGQ9_9PEZI